MRLLGAALVVLVVSGQAGQQPARDQPAQRPGFGTGAVAGRVLNGETRQPIADALVALIGGQTTTIRVGQTDAKGTFILPGVPAGKFVLSASKAPFLGSMYGAPKPARPGTAVVLTEGQIASGLEILMWPGAVVTGTVTDHDGDPVADAEVQLQRASPKGDQMSMMLAMLGSAPRATTDDRGIYRIFGVAPGDYLVMASVPDTLARARRLGPTEVADGLQALREPPRATGRGAAGATSAPAPPLPTWDARFGPGGGPGFAGSSYAPVYFPGTTDMSGATTVSVAMGEERSGVSIRLETVPLARVEGTVFGADGVGAASVLITVQRLDETPFMAMLRSGGRSSQTAANGQFSVRNVAPGRYRVLARSLPTQQAPVTSTFWANADLTIGGQDVGGLVLQLKPALTITGRVAIDDTATTPRPELTAVRAGFIPMDVTREQFGMLAGMVGAGGQAARADGSFEVGGLIPGAHLTTAMVGAENPLSLLTWRVGSVVIDGRDVTDLPFDLKADAMPKSVLVTLTDRHQKLSGVIADSSGRPLTASTVLMFATDRRYWYSQSRRVLAVRPGTDGSYEFSGLLGPSAGEYFLSVVTDLEPGQEYDPVFLDALAKAGPIRLTLGPGESKRQDLKVR